MLSMRVASERKKNLHIWRLNHRRRGRARGGGGGGSAQFYLLVGKSPELNSFKAFWGRSKRFVGYCEMKA